LRLRAAPLDREVSGGYADLSALLRSRTQRTQFSLTPRLRATSYTKNSEENITDWYLNSILTHQAERSRYEVLASLSRQDVIDTALLAPTGGSLGTPGSGDGSVAQIRNSGAPGAACPSAIFVTGERPELQLGASYTDADYNSRWHKLTTRTSRDGRLSVRTSPRTRLLAGLDAGKLTRVRRTGDAMVCGWKFAKIRSVRSYMRVSAVRTQPDTGTARGRKSEFTTLLAGLEQRCSPRADCYFRPTAQWMKGCWPAVERTEGSGTEPVDLAHAVQRRPRGLAELDVRVTRPALLRGCRHGVARAAPSAWLPPWSTPVSYDGAAGTNSTGAQVDCGEPHRQTDFGSQFVRDHAAIALATFCYADAI
jgi:hypothetical protein